MADPRRLRFTIEWDDSGEPDFDEGGNPGGYLAFIQGLSSLGAEVIDEEEI